VYAPVRRRAAHGVVEHVVEASGGRVIFSSGPAIAPLFVGIEGPDGDRIGVNAYVFHANQVTTRNRSFDVVAVCMYGPTGAWTFRYRRSADLLVHEDHPGRIAPLQRITEDWAMSLSDALDAQ
jgi:hypothetical protein